MKDQLKTIREKAEFLCYQADSVYMRETGQTILTALDQLEAMVGVHQAQAEAVPSDVGRDAELRNGALYLELLMAVGEKFPGETRHQTALRYILSAEKPDHRTAIEQQKSNESRPKTCPNKFRPDGTYSGCQLHNLHCAYPNCEK